jgi:hypothetical protein
MNLAVSCDAEASPVRRRFLELNAGGGEVQEKAGVIAEGGCEGA